MASNPAPMMPPQAQTDPMMAGLQSAIDEPGAGWRDEGAQFNNPTLGTRSLPPAVRVLGQMTKVY
jgi:hypothetical protein